MRIRFRTWRHRPPHRVTVRLVRDDRPFPEYTGLYRDSTWVFDVPDGPGTFRLALDGQVETGKAIEPAAVVDLDEDHPDVSFGDLRQLIPVDDGRLQQLWFAQGTTSDELWDVVVVGTGVGGGVLAAELATRALTGRKALKVLSLEAGSMLFPTHVGNLPPVRYGGPAGGLATTIWSTLATLGSRPWDAGREWEGVEVFALGGRSLYWGALCPRVHPEELKAWPTRVCEDLIGPTANWYVKAEDVLGVGNPRAEQVSRDGLALLDAVLPGRDNRLAPVALRREKPTSWRIPGGLFSTAEQLLELRLSTEGRDERGTPTYGVPYIHLGELVQRVEQDGDTWLVHGVDLRDGSSTVRRAERVVLSAGTVESARVLAASGLADLPCEPGAGLTEHPMAYVHFQIPPTSAYCHPASSAKLLSAPGPGTTPEDERWNLVLDLGSDLELTQRDPLAWSGTRTDPGAVAGQLVFLGRADRGPGRVEFAPDRPWPALNRPEPGGLPHATLHPDLRSPEVPGSWQQVADRVLGLLGAEQLPGERTDDRKPTLRRAGLGFVAHEVGTLPMSEKDDGSGMVDANLQVWDKRGLYVCDNSVFPTSPAANPSLTLAALALRLAEHLCA